MVSHWFRGTRLRRLTWAAVIGSLLALLVPSIEALASPAAALVRVLQSGRVPEDRLGPIIDQVCRRGDGEDLAYLLKNCIAEKGYPDAVRQRTLAGMADAASTRKVKPTGDLAVIKVLIDRGNKTVTAETQQLAIRLAGLWKVASLKADVEKLAVDPKSPDALRDAALESLVTMDPKEARKLLDRLADNGPSLHVRSQAIATLARIDLKNATLKTAAILAQLGDTDDLETLLVAIVSRQGGADLLAAALQKQNLPPDTAKLALRKLYVAGHAEGTITAVLTKAAGITTDIKMPVPSEMKSFIAEMQTRGNAARGEAIFRRSDVGCMKCHSVSGAGGEVGPDLSPVGATSPPDYLLTSILLPDQTIKEGFLTLKVVTTDGKVLQGIVVDKNDERIVLKDATGAKTNVPVADIDEQQPGGSLMPKGLANLLTHAELLDLVRFLSELGKPGPYAIRKTQTLQRWRVLRSDAKASTGDGAAASSTATSSTAANSTAANSTAASITVPGAGTPEEAWLPAYARVAGELPLAELVAKGQTGPLVLRSQFDVTVPGEVGIYLDASPHLDAWLDDKPIKADPRYTVALDAGRHTLTLRFDLKKPPEGILKAALFTAAGSKAEAAAVGGH